MFSSDDTPDTHSVSMRSLPSSRSTASPPSRTLRLLAALLVPAALAVVAVLRLDLLTGLIASPRAWLVTAGVFLASWTTRRLLRRWSPHVALWSGPAVTLGLLAVLLVPSFHERTLVEAFPSEIAASADPLAPTASPADPASAAPAASASPTAAVPASPAPPPPPPPPAPAAVPASPAAVASPAPTAPPATSKPSATSPRPVATTPVLAPRLLTSGAFHGIGHQASGQAEVYSLSDRIVIRFASVSFPGAPAQSVHLVPRGARTPDRGTRLGRLKAEHGSFSYTAPVGFDLAKGWTVLVWCDDYAVPIAAADLG